MKMKTKKRKYTKRTGIITKGGFKILTAREIKKMNLLGLREKPALQNPFLSAILGLKKGQAVLVQKKQWDKKSSPYSLFLNSTSKHKPKGFKLSSKTLQNDAGFLLTRVA